MKKLLCLIMVIVIAVSAIPAFVSAIENDWALSESSASKENVYPENEEAKDLTSPSNNEPSELIPSPVNELTELIPSSANEPTELIPSSENESLENNSPQNEELYEAISPTSITPSNATIIVEYTQRELRSTITTLGNPGPNAPPVIIQIPQNFSWQGPDSTPGMIPVSYPNLIIEPVGGGHFTLDSNGNGAFIVRNGGNLTLRGGSQGGSLNIQGNGNNPACIVQLGTLTIESGVSITNCGVGAIQVQNGSTFNLTGNARITNNRNRNGPGGGVYVLAGGAFNMTGGIIEYNTGVNGGGVHIAQGATFNMQAGQIRNNFSIKHINSNTGAVIDHGSGGGLFVHTSNLGNITIGRNAVFRNNVAESGIRINNELAEQYRSTINPSTVSITNLGLYLEEDGNYTHVTPHAFTNYDINTDFNIPQYWKVEHKVAGNLSGKIVAKFATTGVEIPNGSFVPENSEVLFVPDPALLLNKWEIRTRLTEIDEVGANVPYKLTDGGQNTPLSLIITEHTEVTGIFSQGFTLTKDPNGGKGEPLTKWLPPGTHIIDHVPTHENEALKFIAWSTNPDGSGTLYHKGDPIEITRDTTLFAKWELAATTLTISKEVTGKYANKNMPFEFTIYFKDSNGMPESNIKQFSYTGHATDESGATAPADGVLVLDENASAGFSLAHGQAITIEDLPLGSHIQVVETLVGNYQASFINKTDDEKIIPGNDTLMLQVTEKLELHFINDRVYTPPTGINLGDLSQVLLLSALIVFPPLSTIVLRIILGNR